MCDENTAFKLYQPSFMLLKNYTEFKSPGNNGNSIALFYQFQVRHTNRDQVFAVPDGCVDILFCCDQANPFAKVCGSVVKGKIVQFIPEVDYFGIRFLPGYASLFLGYPANDFIEKEILLTEIMRKADRLIDKVVYQGCFNDRVRVFSSRSFVSTDEKIALPALVQYIIKRINGQHGMIRIEELAEESGYSGRYINKTFLNHIGISPKLFCRVVRFQHALELILAPTTKKSGDIVAELGYFDQAHFIREFKEFCLLTPQKLIQISLEQVAN